MISCISVLSAILDISWFYAGMEAFRVTIWRNVLMRLLSIAAIFLFVHSEGDLIVYLGIQCRKYICRTVTYVVCIAGIHSAC